ncbi:GNAT family N-acetyltransferase [Luteimonas sp. 50]|uniref:GNAT family N-acetyltransferase n=1 Tax=Cognatiluteimonas sedimenti TaxID=2927791 RepID=A0ABT0A3E4_9GAMM|nr:GNAT family N-acetyltransferase [Lysobacter sedimenti]MCJ0825506.1 GNAT family N-acetyltransferase [Lysobacter sedimenti]
MTDACRIDIAAALDALPAFPRLRGQRVCLRGPCPGDADALFALFSDPAVMRYWSRSPMAARGEAEGRIAEIVEDFAARKALQWMIAARVDDAVIGTCSLFRFDPRHRRAEVGYALRSDHWGRGLAREAVALALEWGFRTLGLHRIEAGIDPRNAGSRLLLARLGFTSEELLRERYRVGGEAGDIQLFGLPAPGMR